MSSIPLAGRLLALALVAALLVPAAAAQQKIGYVDSSKILPQMPEFQSAQQELDRLTGVWRAEIAAVETEARTLADEFAAREILFTDDERQQQQAAVEAKRAERDALRQRYFGPNGELFREQQTRLRPAQERLLAAIETVADDDEFDYVFDRAGEYVFLYARPRHDLTDRVLQELGVGIGSAVAPGSTR
ncbi:OmpH family outer membrane protein [Rubrivirga sp. IMCC45206]|uniref:OmpH family outer membrane protein n=1 Tax=Rubrivirga sp. IMCC45206 TaxID=3391614 RepID=UPI003990089D